MLRVRGKRQMINYQKKKKPSGIKDEQIFWKRNYETVGKLYAMRSSTAI